MLIAVLKPHRPPYFQPRIETMRTTSTLLFAFMSVIPSLAQFGPGVQITSSFMSRHELKAADLNGDTYQDLVFQNAGATVWCRNLDGLGNFGPLDTLYLSPQYPWQSDHYHGFDLRDVDLDGAIDVIIVDREDSAVVWLPNNGFGSFGPAQIVADLHGRGFLGSMICIDVMDSPFPDVVMNVEHGGKRMIYINDGGSFTTADSIYAQMGGPMSPVLVGGDLDLNGTTDLVLESFFGQIRAMLNFGGAGITWVDTVLMTSFMGTTDGQTPQLIDVDRDGDLDVGDASDNMSYWAENFAFDSVGFHAFIARAINPASFLSFEHYGWLAYLGCGDLASALWSSGADLDTMNWALFDAQLHAFTTPLSWASEPGIILVRTADLNGDGAEDLILAHSDSILTWYPNLLPQQSPGPVALTPFDTLCLYGDPYPLDHAIPAGGSWSGTEVSLNVFTPSAGTFDLTYTVVDPTSGCPLSARQPITVITEATVTVVSGNFLADCDLGPVQFAAFPSPGVWSALVDSTGLMDRSCDVRPVTGYVSYTYTAANGGSCSGEMPDYVMLPGCLNMDLGPDRILCSNGDTLVISANGPAMGGASLGGPFDLIEQSQNYLATGYFYPGHAPGTYVFHGYAVGPMDCPATDSVIVTVVPAPDVALSLPFDILSDNAPPEILEGGNPPGGTYSINGGQVTTFDPSLYGLGPIIVVYTYEDPVTGCSNTAQSVVLVEHITGMRSEDQPMGLRLSPNPTSQQCSVWFDANGDAWIMLTDAVGRVVGTWNATASPFTLQLGVLAPGRYLVNVVQADRVQRTTLLVD